MDLALRRIAKGYLPYEIDQRLLLPPDMRDWLPEGHLALLLLDVVAELDLSRIYAVYDAKDARGRAGYRPAMMVALLLRVLDGQSVFATHRAGDVRGRGVSRARRQPASWPRQHLLGKALSRLTSGSRKQQCPRADPDPMPAP